MLVNFRHSRMLKF